MKGRALNWFQWWEDHQQHRTWGRFKEALLGRFQPGVARNRYGPVLRAKQKGTVPVLRAKQKGTVLEYIEEFEMVTGPMRELDDEMLKGIFMNGLKEELQAELQMCDLETLGELKGRAMLLEERNNAWRRGGFFSKERQEVALRQTTQYNTVSIPSPNTGSRLKAEPKPPEGGLGRGGRGGGRLPQAELHELSRKGLCFKCRERWGPEHVCRFRRYQLLVREADEEEKTGGEEEPVVEEETATELAMKALTLTFNSLWGLTSNKSFKVWGTVRERKIVVMLDSGASTNFISKKLVEELQLEVTATPPYSIEVGNDQKEGGKGFAKAWKLKYKGL